MPPTDLRDTALVAHHRLEEALTTLREAEPLLAGTAAVDAALAEVQVLAALGRRGEAEAVLDRLLTSPGAEAPAGRLQVECLGRFRVRLGDSEIRPDAWERPQVKALFQFLLLQPGYSAGRQAIVAAFWPGEPAGRARAALRVVLHRLRHVLAEWGCSLETATDMVRLAPGTVGWFDLPVFRSHLDAARRLSPASPDLCVEHCRAGRALYSGPLLPGAGPWAAPLRDRLRQEEAELLDLWAESSVRLDRVEEAIHALEELLALDPGREVASRQLLRLLARQGRRGELLQRYRKLVRWLRANMGVDPEPETQALLRQLLG